MRTGDDQMAFCATIMSAARRCGIGIGRASNAGEYRFVWRDPATERVIKGQGSANEKDALESACEALILYFNPT